MPKSLTKPDGYKALVKKILKELAEFEFLIKKQGALTKWKIGKYIYEHLLEYKDRADYGATFYPQLSRDVDRDVSTLQRAVQFYRAYPITALTRKLGWEHYKGLITVKDEKERKKLEQEIIRNNWSTTKFREYLNVKRALAAPKNDGKPTSPAQLKFTRGRLNTYQIVKSNKTLIKKGPLALDLGFRQQHVFAPNFSLKEGDTIEFDFKTTPTGVNKIKITMDELFTYIACIDKIIDGDTLLVAFNFNLEVSISQKLRLRGIDCPEMDTEEGRRAKRFVEARLKNCEFIIVKTYKDRSDKFDRYLPDIFYKADESDPAVVAREGKYLNQELLDEGLAVLWP